MGIGRGEICDALQAPLYSGRGSAVALILGCHHVNDLQALSSGSVDPGDYQGTPGLLIFATVKLPWALFAVTRKELPETLRSLDVSAEDIQNIMKESPGDTDDNSN